MSYPVKASIIWCSFFLMVQLSQLSVITGKIIALILQTFVSRVMSLLFNTPSRFVIAFLPRSNHLSDCMVAVTVQLSTMQSPEQNCIKGVCYSYFIQT